MEKKQLLQNNNGFVGFYPNTHIPFYKLQVNIGSNKSTENFTVEQTVTIDDNFIDTFNKTEEGESIYIRVDIISDTIVSGKNTPIFEGYKGSSGLYFTHTPIINPGKENERICIRNFNITNINIEAKTADVKFAQIILAKNEFTGDGTKFLSDNGTYKTIETGDKTNVLILSLEDDLANGQKNSPVDAEVSAALKDAISTGKACVIKSANSDILANLQQIGNNVTIVMEQISRVGQTFVAINTSITVNTATNIISDYQTGAIVLETEGDGNKFLSNDGTYKESNYIKIEATDFIDLLAKHSNGTVVNIDAYNEIINVIRTADYSKNNIAIYNNEIYNILYNNSGVNEVIVFVKNYTNSVGSVLNRVYGINIESRGNFVKNYFVELTGIGNGTQFLSDDGTYKDVPQPDLSNYLSKTNTTSYTPTANYHPATKKYVDDNKIKFGDSGYVNSTFTLSTNEFNIDTELTSTLKNMNLGDTIHANVFLNDPKPNTNPSINFVITKIREYRTNNDNHEFIFYNVPNAYIKCNILGRILIQGMNTPQTFISNTPETKILTESEYAALGTTPNTNNVLYFISSD